VRNYRTCSAKSNLELRLILKFLCRGLNSAIALTIGASGVKKFRTSSLEFFSNLLHTAEGCLVVHKPELQASLPLRVRNPVSKDDAGPEDETIETLSLSEDRVK